MSGVWCICLLGKCGIREEPLRFCDRSMKEFDLEFATGNARCDGKGGNRRITKSPELMIKAGQGQQEETRKRRRMISRMKKGNEGSGKVRRNPVEIRCSMQKGSQIGC